MNELEIFIATDQPETCPYCGCRSHWLADFSHTNAQVSIHECLNHEQQYLYLVENKAQ